MGVGVLKRFWSLLFVLCLISAQGCKTSKKKREDLSALDKAVTTQPFAVNGRVNSASLLNTSSLVTVSLHPVILGEVNFSDGVASAESDNNGNYSLTVAPQYRGKPAFIRAVVPASGILGMDSFDGDGFELLLAVPELSPQFTNNITMLTHLAATRLSSYSNLGSFDQAALAISDVNTQVASRFGVIGYLPSTPITNIYDEDEWAVAQITSLRYSAMGVAILRAVKSDFPSLSGLDASREFSDSYTSYGMVDNSNNAQVTSYAEVLAQLKQVIKNLKSQGEQIKVLDRLLIEVSTELGLAEVAEADQYDRGKAASSTGLSYVDKAKAMVQDIRQIVSSIDIQSIAGLSNISKLLGSADPFTDKLEGFGVKVDFSELITGEEFDRISLALKQVSLAILDQLICSKKPSCTEVEPSEISVQHTFSTVPGGKGSVPQEFHEFTVTQTLDVCDGEAVFCPVDVDLVFNLDTSWLLFEAEGDALSIGAAAITMNGTLSQGGLTLAVYSSQPQVNLQDIRMGVEDKALIGMSKQSTYVVMESPSNLVLPIELTKNSAEGTQEMKATVRMGLESLIMDLVDTQEVNEFGLKSTTTKFSDVVVSELVNFELDVAGTVSKTSEENFLVSINMAQPGLGFEGEVMYRQSSVEDCRLSYDPSTCIETDLGTEFVGETAVLNENGTDQFIQLNASVGYKAILKGVSDPAIVHLSVSRETPDQSTINGLKVSYPGHSLNLNGQFASSGYITSMGATNLEGIEMAINSDEKGKRYGYLRGPDGKKLANITPTTDLVHIAFDDGYFVSF